MVQGERGCGGGVGRLDKERLSMDTMPHTTS